MLFADTIKKMRESNKMVQRQIAAILEIDTPMYSRIERGERPATRAQVETLASIFKIPTEELINLWLADKVYKVIGEEDSPQQVLNIVSENIIEYKKSTL